MLDSSAAFSLALQVALRSSEAAMLMSVVLITWIIVLRVRLRTGLKRARKLAATWRPVFAEAALREDYAAALPNLERRDLEMFLSEWNAVEDVVKGESTPGLRKLVQRLRVTEDIRKLLRAKRLTPKALATAALGHLKDEHSWADLFAQLDSDNHVLSLLSARALVEIDPARAIPQIIPRILTRQDWPPGRVAALLRRAGPDIAGGPLCRAMTAGSVEQAVCLLPFVNQAPAPLAAATLRTLLHDASDVRVVTACLRAVEDPTLASLVRHYLSHPRWFVRLLAVEALGRIAEREDVERIVHLLSDEQWWVRYRAAQALVALPWLNAADLKAIQSNQRDRFAREILEQAVAELSFS